MFKGLRNLVFGNYENDDENGDDKIEENQSTIINGIVGLNSVSSIQSSLSGADVPRQILPSVEEQEQLERQAEAENKNENENIDDVEMQDVDSKSQKNNNGNSVNNDNLNNVNYDADDTWELLDYITDTANIDVDVNANHDANVDGERERKESDYVELQKHDVEKDDVEIVIQNDLEIENYYLNLIKNENDKISIENKKDDNNEILQSFINEYNLNEDNLNNTDNNDLKIGKKQKSNPKHQQQKSSLKLIEISIRKNEELSVEKSFDEFSKKESKSQDLLQNSLQKKENKSGEKQGKKIVEKRGNDILQNQQDEKIGVKKDKEIAEKKLKKDENTNLQKQEKQGNKNVQKKEKKIFSYMEKRDFLKNIQKQNKKIAEKKLIVQMKVEKNGEKVSQQKKDVKIVAGKDLQKQGKVAYDRIVATASNVVPTSSQNSQNCPGKVEKNSVPAGGSICQAEKTLAQVVRRGILVRKTANKIIGKKISNDSESDSESNGDYDSSSDDDNVIGVSSTNSKKMINLKKKNLVNVESKIINDNGDKDGRKNVKKVNIDVNVMMIGDNIIRSKQMIKQNSSKMTDVKAKNVINVGVKRQRPLSTSSSSSSSSSWSLSDDLDVYNSSDTESTDFSDCDYSYGGAMAALRASSNKSVKSRVRSTLTSITKERRTLRNNNPQPSSSAPDKESISSKPIVFDITKKSSIVPNLADKESVTEKKVITKKNKSPIERSNSKKSIIEITKSNDSDETKKETVVVQNSKMDIDKKFDSKVSASKSSSISKLSNAQDGLESKPKPNDDNSEAAVKSINSCNNETLEDELVKPSAEIKTITTLSCPSISTHANKNANKKSASKKIKTTTTISVATKKVRVNNAAKTKPAKRIEIIKIDANDNEEIKSPLDELSAQILSHLEPVINNSKKFIVEKSSASSELELESDDLIGCNSEASSDAAMDESWYVTPPPCFNGVANNNKKLNMTLKSSSASPADDTNNIEQKLEKSSANTPKNSEISEKIIVKVANVDDKIEKVDKEMKSVKDEKKNEPKQKKNLKKRNKTKQIDNNSTTKTTPTAINNGNGNSKFDPDGDVLVKVMQTPKSTNCNENSNNDKRNDEIMEEDEIDIKLMTMENLLIEHPSMFIPRLTVTDMLELPEVKIDTKIDAETTEKLILNDEKIVTMKGKNESNTKNNKKNKSKNKNGNKRNIASNVTDQVKETEVCVPLKEIKEIEISKCDVEKTIAGEESGGDSSSQISIIDNNKSDDDDNQSLVSTTITTKIQDVKCNDNDISRCSSKMSICCQDGSAVEEEEEEEENKSPSGNATASRMLQHQRRDARLGRDANNHLPHWQKCKRRGQQRLGELHRTLLATSSSNLHVNKSIVVEPAKINPIPSSSKLTECKSAIASIVLPPFASLANNRVVACMFNSNNDKANNPSSSSTTKQSSILCKLAQTTNLLVSNKNNHVSNNTNSFGSIISNDNFLTSTGNSLLDGGGRCGSAKQMQFNQLPETTPSNIQTANSSMSRSAKISLHRQLAKSALNRQNQSRSLVNNLRRADRRTRMAQRPNGCSINRKVHTNFASNKN